MVKNLKAYLIAIMALAMCIFTFLSLSTLKVFAYSGNATTLTEQQLYNATNTYNVDNTGFTDGTYHPDSDKDDEKITNDLIYNIRYNMSQKNDNQVMSITQITVLTHGLGSNAGAWSNHYSENNSNDSFAYDPESLISQISDSVGGAKIYWAKMSGYNSFNLFDITNQTSTTSGYNKNSSINTVTDISKHIIIVFDAFRTTESNNNIYYQFNYMLSKIIYDVKIANGGILPKVNLVGHSRGGLTNLQYALDHPDLVSTLISLGTPYFSSTTANLFGEALMGAGDGLDDILNPDIYYEYNTRWNQNYNTLYKDIKAYAIGSYHTLSSLVEVVSNDSSGELSDAQKSWINAGLWSINTWKLASFAFIADRFTLGIITEILDVMYPSLQVVDAAEILLNEINYDVHPMFVSWYNDVLVNLDSQLANDNGAVGRPNSGSYLGFNRITRTFLMNDEDVNYEKVSQKDVPVGHNLIARDKIVIAEILNVLEINYNSDSEFVTMENQDGTITFVRHKGGYQGTTFYVPETIDDKTVTEISAHAFSNLNNVTEIVLPNTIKNISSYAFVGLENLTTVSFTGNGLPQLERIGYGAFAGCTNLNKFNFPESGSLALPTSVEFIDSYAFYGTGFSYVSLETNVYYIGDCAFANITSLTRITVATANTNYFSEAGVLYNYDGWLMQYPIAKTNTSFTVPSSLFNVEIRYISQFAFMGESDLTSINLSNVISIDSHAFMGCTGLVTFANSLNVEYVGAFALDDTVYFSQAQNFVTLGKVLYRYKGTSTVLNTNNFPTGITRISANAFSSNDNIQQIYLSNQVLDIDNNAFIDCPNLTKITCYNTTLPDIGEYPFVGLHNDFKFYCRKSIIDSINEQHMWNAQKDLMYPIATTVTFIDLSTTKTFYYGEIIDLSGEPTKENHNFVGWKRFDLNTEQVYGEYLTPIVWNETVSELTLKAVFEPIVYTLDFYNWNNFVGRIVINVGDTYSIAGDRYIINGVEYIFENWSHMANCYYKGLYMPYNIYGVNIADFVGWATASGQTISTGQWTGGQVAEFNYYANWVPVDFTITFYDGYSDEIIQEEANYLDGIVLQAAERYGFNFVCWHTLDEYPYYVGTKLHPLQDIVLTAVWERGLYSITYTNLTFMGQDATVGWDGNTYQGAPTSYEYGTGIDLTRASAYWQGSAPNNSKLVFLGWYADISFTTKIIAITPYDTGNKTLYAKWRYDFGYTHRTGTYTIEDDEPYSGYYDTIYIGLNSNNLYQELQNIGIHYLTIEFKIKVREVKDGYQKMSLYVETSPGTNPVWAVEDLDHELPSGATNDYIYYIYHWTFDIDDVYNCNYLYVRYGAKGVGSDTWVTDRAYIDVMYSATEDTEEYVQAFTWENSSGVSDSSCTPLENISDDI